MRYTPEVVETARGRLLELRDGAFFDKLKQAFGYEPANDRERFSLIKLADDLQTAHEAGALSFDEEDRFAAVSKQASDFVASLHGSDDESAYIGELAAKIAADNPVLAESAGVFFEAVVDEEGN